MQYSYPYMPPPPNPAYAGQMQSPYYAYPPQAREGEGAGRRPHTTPPVLCSPLVTGGGGLT